MAVLGIRREDKNRWERRAPLTPDHVAELVADQGRRVVVQPSPIRIFADEEYRHAGAIVQEDLSECQAVLAVKEIPVSLFRPHQAYTSFFHVIKGQAGNLPMLSRALAVKATLIDYERIVDRFAKRLIFFGRHAGYAGMVDALWALGRRLLVDGVETPFAALRPAHAYRDLDEAHQALAGPVAHAIREAGVPAALHPLVVGFTGGGNVSQGAQAVFDRLPAVEVHPDELATLAEDRSRSRHALYKVVFRRDHRADFARHLPHLSLLVNGIYWQPGHPRLLARTDAEALWGGESHPTLKVVADLSCDLEGSIELTTRIATIDDPLYVAEPATGRVLPGVEGRGPVILAVDNLPAEFPRDASEHFGDALFPFLAGLAAADFEAPFEHLALPAALLGAVVAHAGELAPEYRYLESHLERARAEAAAVG